MRRGIAAFVAVVLATVLPACGSRETAPGAAPKPEAPGGQPAQATPSTAEPSRLPTPKSEYEAGLEKIQALEDAVRLGEAHQACVELRAKVASQLAQLDARAARLEKAKDEAAKLDGALARLDSEKPEDAKAATDEFLKAGEGGRMLLRKAVRDGKGRKALAAVEILAKLNDPEAPRVFADVLQAGPAESLHAALAQGLRDLDPAPFAAAWARVKDDRSFKERSAVAILAAYLAEAFGGDADKFGAAVKDPQAAPKLKAYLEAALNADDKALNEWAVTSAAMAGAYLKGLRGQYYEGTNFEKLVFERLDAKIDVPDRQFTYPDGRQENLSIRWTGFVRIKRASQYTFSITSDDGQRLWIDDKLLIDDWTMHGAEEREAMVALRPGLHAVKIEYMQGGGNGLVQAQWSGQGMDKGLLTDAAVCTPPWRKK